MVEKVERCSDVGPVIADMLSMDKWDEVEKIWPRVVSREWVLRLVPPLLQRWLNNPVVDDKLGQKVLEELRKLGVPVLIAARMMKRKLEEME